jgi:hypothetical protein
MQGSASLRPARHPAAPLASAFLVSLLAGALLAGCGGGLDDSSSSSSGSGSGGSSTSSNSSSSLAACDNISYPGDKSDPQVYTFDAAAQFRACQYKATGNASYLDIGNQTCATLDGFLKSVNSTFRPLYCSGSRLKV